MTGLEDGFTGAGRKVEAEPAGFDAGQYSFFGDLGEDEGLGGLDGALEEGLEAPPEEELALDADLQLGADEDLSYASMFALGLDSEAVGDKLRGERALDAAGSSAGLNGAGRMDAVLQEAPLTTPPPKFKPGSIALGGLLAGTPSGLPTTPLGQASPFGGLGSTALPASSGGGLLGTPGFGTPIGGLHDPAIAHVGPSPPQQPLPSAMPSGPRPLSAQDLEAQLLGASLGQQHAAPLLQGPPPPYPGMPPPHVQQPPMGARPYPPGMQPPLMQPPLQGGLPPPLQPHSHMQPPPFDANGHPYPRPPPPMHGGPLQGPPQPMMPPGGGVLPPEGMLQPPPHRPYPPPPGHPMHYMGGPPMGLPPHMGPPPPPLGGGMPRGPPMMRPGMHLPPHMRPGGPGGPFRPHGPPMGPPMHPGAWGRPGFPPGFQQQQQQQQVTLAQRLRALNLADRYEAERYPVLRRRYHSKYMDHEEIESILHMQWRPLHQGSPYAEDYYYQAFVYKHYGRRNRRTFAPESVRELAPTEKVAPDQVAFVKLDGLGKVPFSNIRRPRPLMDVTPHQAAEAAEGSEAGGEGEDGGASAATAAPSKPLEQEPLLAARIMIEDCMALLLDVEDIDRIFVAAAGGALENEAALRTRRVLLMEGFSVSLRLPEAPAAAEAGRKEGGARPELSDGVFLRLMSLPKGKALIARALRLVYPPPEALVPQGEGQAEAGAPQQQLPPNLRVMWAVMRNLRALFGGRAAGGRGGKDALAVKDDLAASAKLADSAADLVRQLATAQAVCDCAAAILAGDLDGSSLPGPEGLLLPLSAPGHKAGDGQLPWLANILEALLQRAAELDLISDSPEGEGTSAGSELAPAWQQHFGQLYALLHRHTAALHEAFAAGREMHDAEGCAEVRALVPIALLRTAMPHCSGAQQEELRTMLMDFGA